MAETLGHRLGRPARRIAAGAAVVGVMYVGGVAVGLGGDFDGRDGTGPGTPTDAPTPVDIDQVDDGRSTADVVGEPAPSTQSESGDGSVATSTRDNGRGGPDPEIGPNAPTRGDLVAATVDELREFDTDSGEAPAPALDDVERSETVEPAAVEEPVDQDVPGAPTDHPDGPDDPADDSDG